MSQLIIAARARLGDAATKSASHGRRRCALTRNASAISSTRKKPTALTDQNTALRYSPLSCVATGELGTSPPGGDPPIQYVTSAAAPIHTPLSTGYSIVSSW